MADEGKDTTEYKVASSAGAWGVVAMLIGAVISIGGSVAQSLGTDSTVGIIIGGIVATAGAFLKTMTGLGYIKSRTDVKTTPTTTETTTT